MTELAMRILAIVTLLWAGLGLLSCGNKGPLYLPEPEVAWTDFQPGLTLHWADTSVYQGRVTTG